MANSSKITVIPPHARYNKAYNTSGIKGTIGYKWDNGFIFSENLPMGKGEAIREKQKGYHKKYREEKKKTEENGNQKNSNPVKGRAEFIRDKANNTGEHLKDN